nr:uncharacterized protein LOC123765139 [Procambarus clarkii]
MRIITLVVVVLLSVTTHATIFTKRVISEDATYLNDVGAECDRQSPCGWEIYGDLRRHVYYLRNECDCPSGTRCIRVEDDILQEAYVYKCRRIGSPKY